MTKERDEDYLENSEENEPLERKLDGAKTKGERNYFSAGAEESNLVFQKGP